MSSGCVSTRLKVEFTTGIPQENNHEPLPQEAVNEAMGEVRDVMLQYTMCADPTEREARKERVRQAEERGQMEEAAIHMVRASLSSPNVTQPTTVERIPASHRLGPNPPMQDANMGVSMESPPSPHERLPASLRLGLSPQAESQRCDDNGTHQTELSRERIPTAMRLGASPHVVATTETVSGQNVVKRKPGRPPGVRKDPGKETGLASTAAKKRKVPNKPSPRRKIGTGSKTGGTRAKTASKDTEQGASKGCAKMTRQKRSSLTPGVQQLTPL
ncbi:hypothetical protein IGI04_041676 [Brassica rapa subsp. trilocularis]|uniref:Uncharacterized protein n=1 Tax=Brassica rapa subsp. trilocularis TaxID=1813537 RepID=A0ABQ7KUG2_BRACM|nr:hypothetical protein IGI04_041676 [Brassica rapa subsp. trilocularis]